MVVILVVMAISVGIINYATRESAGANAGARRQALVSCAEAARQVLMSRFHALGLSPTSIEALNVPLDGTGGTTLAVGGHIGENPATTVQVNQVTILPENAFGKSSSVRDITNIIPLTGQGGKPTKVIVHCVVNGDGTPTSGRQLEVEFGVRYGL
jgi:type II secretory pathway pseudopilin PulG